MLNGLQMYVLFVRRVFVNIILFFKYVLCRVNLWMWFLSMYIQVDDIVFVKYLLANFKFSYTNCIQECIANNKRGYFVLFIEPFSDLFM